MSDKIQSASGAANTARPVVTRFAPSPTGTLHIGGARTALFNWLYARHTGGKFLLRIEDTDRERSKPEHVQAILDSLKWLELDWDGEPLFQFARADRHREVAKELLAAGKAYNCYMSADELALRRMLVEQSWSDKKATGKNDGKDATVAQQPTEAPVAAEKRSLIVESPWRDADPATAPAGVKPALRLRAPREGETIVIDQVQGRVVVPNKDLDDMIILRSDGAPTYNFAVVVDDHDMGVTNVIRGVDHLTNTARQTQVYNAMGWELPAFAHIPLVHGADGAKLSKRHGAQGVEEYRAMGYLPAALRNYLARLGWSHGDDEVFSTEQAVAWFDVVDVGKSPGRFDFAKLGDLNGQYIRKSLDKELLAAVQDYLHYAEGGPRLAANFMSVGWDRLAAALPGLKERAKTLPELVDGAQFLIVGRPLALDDKARKLIDADAKATLADLATQFAAAPTWDAPTLEGIVRVHAESLGLKLGKVAQPLRAALTGRAVSPPVFDVMAVLGRVESLARISDQI